MANKTTLTAEEELLNLYKQEAYKHNVEAHENLNENIEDIMCWMSGLIQEETRDDVSPQEIVELMENIMHAASSAQDSAREQMRNLNTIRTVNEKLGVN